MAAHDAVMAGLADEACLLTIMGSEVFVLDNTGRERKSLTKRPPVEYAFEVDPLAAVV
jgi:hypothetical protein